MKKRIKNLLVDACIVSLAVLTCFVIIRVAHFVNSPRLAYFACVNAFIYGGIFTLIKIQRMQQFVHVNISPDQAANLREMVEGSCIPPQSFVLIGEDGKVYPPKQNNTCSIKNPSCCGEAGTVSACHDNCRGNEVLADRLQSINYSEFKNEAFADPTCSQVDGCDKFPYLNKGTFTIEEGDSSTVVHPTEPDPSLPGPSDRGEAATEYRKEDEQIPLHYLGAAYADPAKPIEHKCFPSYRKATPEEVAEHEARKQMGEIPAFVPSEFHEELLKQHQNSEGQSSLGSIVADANAKELERRLAIPKRFFNPVVMVPLIRPIVPDPGPEKKDQ